MEQATTIGLDIAKHVFQLQRKLGASSRWKPAPARTTGRVKSLK